MGDVFQLEAQRVFSLDEAQELFPVIYRITRTAQEKVQTLIDELEKLPPQDSAAVGACEEQAQKLIVQWQRKIEMLGAYPKGLWLVDLDSGDGYFCWKYPEPRIEFWHNYQDGYSKRVRIVAEVKENKPIRLPTQASLE